MPIAMSHEYIIVMLWVRRMNSKMSISENHLTFEIFSWENVKADICDNIPYLSPMTNLVFCFFSFSRFLQLLGLQIHFTYFSLAFPPPYFTQFVLPFLFERVYFYFSPFPPFLPLSYSLPAYSALASF